MRFVSAIAVVCVVLIPSAQASKQRTLPEERPSAPVVVKKQQRSVKQQRALKTSRATVGILRAKTWQCQDALDLPRTRASASLWALPASIPYRHWVGRLWASRARSCAQTLQRRTIPATNDWLTAVRLVQRSYPGTYDWLYAISKREGGHGGFVMNHQGSGCGGWMQYAASTYWAYSGDAFADIRRRGFIVDDAWNQWTNPMGQAITAGYMRFTGRDGHHWDL